MPTKAKQHRAHTGAAARPSRAQPNATKRGYGYKWQKAREAFLRAHPLCVECHANDRVALATVVDHIKAHKGDKALFWDRNNWQSLCKPCHDRKTASDDGGFGRPVGGG